jgi:hypothetical protein
LEVPVPWSGFQDPFRRFSLEHVRPRVFRSRGCGIRSVYRWYLSLILVPVEIRWLWCRLWTHVFR